MRKKTEVEKLNDDQLLISHSVNFAPSRHTDNTVKSSFFYTANFDNEIYRKLLSPASGAHH